MLRWSPDRRFTAAAGAGAVVLLALAVFAADGPSRLLFAVGVLVLVAFVVGDVAYSPRLEASAGGVVVRSPLVRVSLTWPQIEAVRSDTRARYGMRSTTLEVDAGETLAVLSRRALGADPDEVAERINELRPR